MKIFIGDGDDESEVFLNFNPVSKKAQFSEKDVDYGDAVVAKLATCFDPPEIAVLDVSPAIRNVWSAALLQAKSEDGRLGLRKCIRSLCEPKLWTLMGCAALSS
jgi:hypothetical protein